MALIFMAQGYVTVTPLLCSSVVLLSFEVIFTQNDPSVVTTSLKEVAVSKVSEKKESKIKFFTTSPPITQATHTAVPPFDTRCAFTPGIFQSISA